MLTTTTVREEATPSGSVVTVTVARPSLLARLVVLMGLAVLVVLGIVVIVPLLIVGAVLVVAFALYTALHRSLGRLGAAGAGGRRNVRVVDREREVG